MQWELPVGCDFDDPVVPFVATTDFDLLDLAVIEPALSGPELRGPDGMTVLAPSYEQFVQGPLSVTRVEVMESGLAPDGALLYWTGAYGDGTLAPHCEDWAAPEGLGAFGSMDWGNSAVPSGWLYSGEFSCNASANLLCLCGEPLR